MRIQLRLSCDSDSVTEAVSGANEKVNSSPGEHVQKSVSQVQQDTGASQVGMKVSEKAKSKVKAAQGSYPIDRLAKMLYIGVAYAATIGGVATLTGTPTNLILIENLRKYALEFIHNFLFVDSQLLVV